MPALAGVGLPLFHPKRFFRFVLVFSDAVVVVVFEELVEEDSDLNSEGTWGLFVW